MDIEERLRRLRERRGDPADKDYLAEYEARLQQTAAFTPVQKKMVNQLVKELTGYRFRFDRADAKYRPKRNHIRLGYDFTGKKSGLIVAEVVGILWGEHNFDVVTLRSSDPQEPTIRLVGEHQDQVMIIEVNGAWGDIYIKFGGSP